MNSRRLKRLNLRIFGTAAVATLLAFSQGSIVVLLSSCQTDSTADNETAPVEDLSALDSNPNGATDSSSQAAKSESAGTANEDEFSQFDDKPKAAESVPSTVANPNPEGKADEFAQFDDTPPEPQAVAEAKKDETPPPAEPPVVTAEQTSPPTEVPPPAAEPPVAPPVEAQAPVQEPPAPAPEAPAPEVAAPSEPVAAKKELVSIKSIQFKGNDNGGTLIVQADGPLAFSTRLSAQTGQFVVDIPNSQLAKRLTRPLITRDFAGSIGSVDAYQDRGSTTSRVVVHLRPGASEPVVQAEGNSLLIVASETAKETSPVQAEEAEASEPETSLMGTASLSEFLSSESKFSGKKISIETDDMDLSELFRLLADEGRINLVLALGEKSHEKVKLKLRQVPWDQVLVMVMRTHKLGYTRTGNVLRIVPMSDLQQEEKDAMAMYDSKQVTAPLIVKMIPISYSDVDKLGDKVKPFLSKRGTYFTDSRTASLVVSDIQDNVERIQKVIKSIDIAPQQVLIEGKIVEAQENFTRQMGVQWNMNGLPQTLGQASSGAITSQIPVNVSSGSVPSPTGTIGLSLGILDVLGDLTATLSLQEQEGKIKVLASPRVVTMHNEEAVMSESQEIPYKTVQPSQLGASLAQVSFATFHLDMKVTPLITNEGGVIMKIKVIREYPGDVTDLAAGTRPKNSRQAETRVLVRNGQTAVIGGIFQNDTSNTEYRVPWLGTLPVVGWLFKGTNTTSNKNELLIFVTPRILAQLDGKAISSSADGEGATAQ